MSFWKITTGNKPEKVSSTRLKNEHLLERHLEDWVADNSSILGEALLIIGRQIIIPEVKDRLDLLALDPSGNAVIIELKRGKLTDPIDMQALRYASYISKWEYEDFEKQASSYLRNGGDFNFNEYYENFCMQVGVDEIPDINNNQRIIIVGSEVKDKLGSVALWLYEHSIDIKVIEIDSYKEGETLLIQPKTIIPQAVNKFSEIGKAAKGDVSKPWMTDGKSWHLEKRMRPRIKEMYLRLDSIIKDNISVDGPSYDQKNYITYQLNGYNWLFVGTHASSIVLLFSVKTGSMEKAKIAKQLGVEEFDTDDTLSEKLNLSSSVNVKTRNESTDRIHLRIKEEFDLTKQSVVDFLKETIKNSTKV